MGQNQDLVAVANARDAVLAPAVSLGPGEVVRQMFPGISVGRVVFANGGPGPIGDIRAPAPPTVDVVGDFSESAVFRGRHGEFAGRGRRWWLRLGLFCLF